MIFLPEVVSPFRAEAIRAFGAEVIRVKGNYDDAVRTATVESSKNGWLLISDTATPDYREIPRLVMAGYSLLLEEALEQMAGREPSHVFVQVGCGGLAAVVAGYFRARAGRRPIIIGVEPSAAPCLFRTIEAGQLTTVTGEHDTVMGGLACGEVSYIAWNVLQKGIDFVLDLPDEYALAAVRALAGGKFGRAVSAGESGAAGVGALLALAESAELQRRVGMDQSSRILALITEGVTDPDQYRAIIQPPQAH